MIKLWLNVSRGRFHDLNHLSLSKSLWIWWHLFQPAFNRSLWNLNQIEKGRKCENSSKFTKSGLHSNKFACVRACVHLCMTHAFHFTEKLMLNIRLLMLLSESYRVSKFRHTHTHTFGWSSKWKKEEEKKLNKYRNIGGQEKFV